MEQGVQPSNNLRHRQNTDEPPTPKGVALWLILYIKSFHVTSRDVRRNESREPERRDTAGAEAGAGPVAGERAQRKVPYGAVPQDG